VFSEKDGREVPDTISVVLDYPETVINWQSTFSNKAYGLGDRILGTHGTIERLQGSTDMVSGKPSGQTMRYYPEKTNRPDGTPLSGSGAEENAPHVANFLECLRSRKPTTATVDVGYKSALAVHMANISYRLKRRVTEAEARKLAGHGLHGEGGRPDLA
jgi:hypothetical protein